MQADRGSVDAWIRSYSVPSLIDGSFVERFSCFDTDRTTGRSPGNR